jgi:hypothetical protein
VTSAGIDFHGDPYRPGLVLQYHRKLQYGITGEEIQKDVDKICVLSILVIRNRVEHRKLP